MEGSHDVLDNLNAQIAKRASLFSFEVALSTDCIQSQKCQDIGFMEKNTPLSFGGLDSFYVLLYGEWAKFGCLVGYSMYTMYVEVHNHTGDVSLVYGNVHLETTH